MLIIASDAKIVNKLVAEALKLIYKDYLNHKEAVHRALVKYKIDDIKLSRIVTGKVHWILKYLYFVDFILDNIVKGGLKRLKLETRILLEIATFEMLVREVKPPIATSSAINLARELKWDFAIPFLSAVLRQVEKEWENVLDSIEDEELRFCVENSFPYEFYQVLKKEWGKLIAKRIVSYSLKPPVDYIRVNLIKISPENLVHRLERKGIELEETEFFDVFKVTYKKVPLVRLEEFQKGYFVIQDKASASVAHYLEPQPDEKIIDLTAAPGNKTFHVASLTEGKAGILAVDYKCDRLKTMKLLAKRLGLKNIEFKCMNALKLKGEFDKAIVDPSCTSTGTFQKYPEVKLHFNFLYNKQLPYYRENQRKLIEKGLELAETISYSTCSLLKEEGEEQTKSYKKRKERRFFPWDETIGFYVAILRR